MVKTSEGLSPLHRPVMPSSARMLFKVVRNETDLLASCCRVAMTETGMVKSWANAAARAPRASSVLKKRKAEVSQDRRRGERERRLTPC